MILTLVVCPGPSRTRYGLFCDDEDFVCIERNQFCDGVRDCDTTDNDEVIQFCEIGRYCVSVATCRAMFVFNRVRFVLLV